MPAKSAKQERFMQAVAHNPKFAADAGVPQSVGKEFTKPRFAKGGSTAYIDNAVAAAVGDQQPASTLPKDSRPGTLSKGEVSPADKAKRAAGPPEEMLKRRAASEPTYAKGGSIDGCAQRGKTRGKVV
jgi:hypothetical protein